MYCFHISVIKCNKTGYLKLIVFWITIISINLRYEQSYTKFMHSIWNFSSIHILCYFYLVNLWYCHLFCPTGRRGFTSVLSAAFCYGNLGRVSPPRSDKHPSSSALSKSRSSPSCCYSIWLLPSAVIVTFSWTRMIWKNLHVGQKR